VDDELLRALARRQARSRAENDPAMHTATDESYDESEGNDALMRPLDAAEREAVLDAVFSRLDAGDVADSEPVGAVAPAIALESRRPSRGRLGAMLGAAVAIAAALVLWIARPGVRPGEALPDYAISTLHGGASTVRSDPTEVDRTLVLTDGAQSIDVVVAPAHAVTGPVAVTLIAEASDRPAQLVAVDSAEISPSGSVRLRGPLSKFIVLEPGTWQLWIVITRADDRPTSAEAARDDEAQRRVGFRVELRGTNS
jgi:hypothetical protein